MWKGKDIFVLGLRSCAQILFAAVERFRKLFRNYRRKSLNSLTESLVFFAGAETGTLGLVHVIPTKYLPMSDPAYIRALKRTYKFSAARLIA